MYKEILRSIDNVEIYPVFSFVLFGLFFIGMLILVFRLDKKHINDMSNLPLSGNENSINNLNIQKNETRN